MLNTLDAKRLELAGQSRILEDLGVEPKAIHCVAGNDHNVVHVCSIDLIVGKGHGQRVQHRRDQAGLAFVQLEPLYEYSLFRQVATKSLVELE